MRQIPLPQSPDAKDWNAAVVQINNYTQAQYGVIDRALDDIEERKDLINDTVKELQKQKSNVRIWLDFLKELVGSYK